MNTIRPLGDIEMSPFSHRVNILSPLTASICSAEVSLSKTGIVCRAQGRCYASIAVEKMDFRLKGHKIVDKKPSV